MNNRIADTGKKAKTCLYCAYWKPEGTIKGITRKGGKCLLTDKESKLEASCWGWKACSTKQLEQRKNDGLMGE